MRLNLGCGTDVRPGYTNVDFRAIHPSVTVCDLSQFPWPFSDGSAEEILMLDFLEHLPYGMTIPALSECWRILRDDGSLVVQAPDGEHLMHALGQSGPYLCNSCGAAMGLPHREECRTHCEGCGKSADDISEAAMRRLYGGQDYVGNFHQTCFTRRSLVRVAASCGFTEAVEEEHDHQYANWNIRYRFRKGDPWGNA